MPIELVPPGSIPRPVQGKNDRATAQAVWNAWMTGVSPNTLGARRGDLASFGDKTWRVRNEIAVIRRVIATLADGSDEIRELVEAWTTSERARGIALPTLARRWSTIASLVRSIAEHVPRPRGTLPPMLPPIPTQRVALVDRASVVAIVARCCAAEAYDDGAMVGVLGELGHSAEKVATLRVAELRRIVAAAGVSTWTRTAAAEVCGDRPPHAWAFGGQRRGDPISRRGVGLACERHGTTPAALIRCAGGDS